MTTVEVLEAARAKIDTPEKWCKGRYHKFGGEAGPATAHCAVGALWEVTGTGAAVCSMMTVLAKANGLRDAASVYSFNDDPARTHDEVLAAFDRAIQLAKSGDKP